jgi:hypothetical protein
MSKNEFGRSFQHYENYFECSEHATNPEHFNYAIVKFFHRGIEPEFEDEMDKFLWKMIRPSIACSRRQSNRGQGAPAGNNNNPGGVNQYSRGQSKGQSTPQSAGQTNRNRNRNKNIEDSLFSAEGDAPAPTKTLSFPYSSQKFADTWQELCRQPKWKKKSIDALQKSLNKIAAYPEAYAIVLMEDAIANNYQGLVFANTPANYEQWKKNNSGQPTPPRREARPLSKEEMV